MGPWHGEEEAGNNWSNSVKKRVEGLLEKLEKGSEFVFQTQKNWVDQTTLAQPHLCLGSLHDCP